MSLKERAIALGFSSAGEMVKKTGYVNSALYKMQTENKSRFEAITLSARVGEMTIEEFKKIGSKAGFLMVKPLNKMTAGELHQLFGEA